jgi:hypothetical protein
MVSQPGNSGICSTTINISSDGADTRGGGGGGGGGAGASMTCPMAMTDTIENSIVNKLSFKRIVACLYEKINLCGKLDC